jgi:short-subunit dehydrogenase
MNPELFCQKYGPWALIAGASQGIGAEYAHQLAGRGLNLVLVARRTEPLQLLADEIAGRYPVQVRPIALDLAQPGAVEALMAQVQELEIGLLVCNAAYSAIGEFLQTPLADHLREIDTNVRSPLILTYQFGQLMAQRGRGGIILMSSLSAGLGAAMVSNYAATKAYTRVLGEGLWEELRSRSVDVLVSSPSAVSTPNYLNSLKPGEPPPVRATAPKDVVRETLAALGRQPGVTPGLVSRLQGFVMSHLIPRTIAIRIMGKVLREMYAK